MDGATIGACFFGSGASEGQKNVRVRLNQQVRAASTIICSSAIISLLAAIAVLGCGFTPSFDTPFATVETYVWAYNNNDQALMGKCGFNADLYKLFRHRVDVGVGEPKYDIVTDIRAELLYKEWARPKATRQYTSERMFLTVRFTSASDPTYEIKSKVLLVKRRSSFTDFKDPIRWQLMPLSVAKEEEAGDAPFR